ncbi:hypothetical protein [Jeotgalibacillus campisalis]|uniref:Uncharacterized protein n=1 Tax=Jeotgalibacillus campisalis TaxID=220754 RepID=A0A0C2RRU8_9BACL|nr:hypothetical protein [Jeotgalibacillus campisalis]KIL52965.1 hypothetical protein KR50_02940 [Jeotgalibacillus campisalis]
MQIQQTQSTSRDLIERWIVQHVLEGRSNSELEGTMFVYGNEAYTLEQTSQGALSIIEYPVSNVVVFRKKEEADPANVCRACGLDYSSFKEAIECCADVD